MAKKSSPPPPGKAKVKLASHATEKVPRSKLVEAPYNPRKIDDWAFKKLTESVKKFGLVDPPIWNRRTGHVVGGHQRLRAADEVFGGTDYEVDVVVIDVPEKREKQLNVVLNNPTLTGEYDLEKLRDLIGEGAELSPDDVLFDPITVEDMYLGSDWEEEFRQPEPEAVEDAGAELRAMAEARKAEGKADYEGAPIPPDEDAPFGRTATGEAIRDPEAHEALKAERERTREKFAAMNDAADSEYYVIAVLGSREEREALMTGLGHRAEEKYVNGRALMDRLGIAMPKTEEA